MKTICKLEGEFQTIRVVYDADWNEYICQVTRNGKRCEAADYHTDDRADAIATGELMADAI